MTLPEWIWPTERRSAIPAMLASLPSPSHEKSMYEAIAAKGVDEQKMRRYLRHSGRGRFVDKREVVNASEVGATGFLERGKVPIKMTVHTFVHG